MADAIDLECESNIWFVGTIRIHCFLEFHSIEWNEWLLLKWPATMNQIFDQMYDVLVSHKAHLHIYLGKFRLSVWLKCFISIALGYLVVSVKT
ncbi:hypothetical protein BpHYR1_012582 [Brachionus plicatilis]|uniref:Uncharacterized protein n=1 Tax=Brachionus plicatilis TaxID=10195 RepID=A0A3M7T227_BRAPC|nr:hypothetical protein BpHYR1_012582 [Brachionus plicatilis]